MGQPTKTMVTKEMLYAHCRDFGLMLSWGMTPMAIIEQMKNNPDNPFDRHISEKLNKTMLQGENPVEAYYDCDGFDIAFTGWFELGVKYGILDAVLSNMAAVIKFGKKILCRGNEDQAKELGNILEKYVKILHNRNHRQKSQLWEAFRQETQNSCYSDFADYIITKKPGELFADSTSRYLNDQVFRKTAAPLFWHNLEVAEKGGFLPDMMSIFSSILVRSKSFVTPFTIIMKSGDAENSCNNQCPEDNASTKTAVQLLEKISKMEDGIRFSAVKEGSVVCFSEAIMPDKAGKEQKAFLKTHKTIDIAAYNTLKILLGIDPLENQLPQHNIKPVDLKSGIRCFSSNLTILPPQGSDIPNAFNGAEEWNICSMPEEYEPDNYSDEYGDDNE